MTKQKNKDTAKSDVPNEVKQSIQTKQKIINKLSEPFSIEDVKQRVGNTTSDNEKAMPLNYVDSRAVQKRLDRVVTPFGWQDDYKEVKGTLYCGISIKVGNTWVTKWDAGSESNYEKEKGEASDAFKRASVKWGIGRFLYDIPTAWLRTKQNNSGKVTGFEGEALEAYRKRLEKYLDELREEHEDEQVVTEEDLEEWELQQQREYEEQMEQEFDKSIDHMADDRTQRNTSI